MGTTTWAGATAWAKTEPENGANSRARIPSADSQLRFLFLPLEDWLIFIFYSFIEKNSKTVFSSASIKQEVKEQLG
jgi:hypothetical protein